MSSPYYVRPFLDVERIELVDPATLRLHAGARSIELSVDGSAQAARASLEALRSPDAFAWDMDADGDGDAAGGGLGAVLRALETRGWIGDADARDETVADERARREALVADALRWTVRAAHELEEPARARFVARLRALAGGAPLHEQLAGEALAGADLSTLVLAEIAAHWRRTSPLAAGLLALVARRACAALGVPLPDALATADSAAVDAFALAGERGLDDVRDAGRRVESALGLAVLGAAADRRALAFELPEALPAAPAAGRRTGIAALVGAERAADAVLARLDLGALERALTEPRSAERAARLVFLHQCLVTERYPEVVMAFLAHGLRRDVRALGYRYFFEEYGHDAHEREAARALGLSDEQIETFAPLPLLGAYPELLAAYAARDPLAFCLCITVAEGLPHSAKAARLVRAPGFEAELTAHAQIDVELDHASFTRRLLSLVPAVGDEAYRVALRRFLIVLELSQRAWAALARYAGSGGPVPPPPFATSARELAALHRG